MAGKELTLREPKAELRGQFLVTDGRPSGPGPGPEHQGRGPESGPGQLGLLRLLAFSMLHIWDQCLGPTLPGNLRPWCVVTEVKVLMPGQCTKEK